MPCVVLGRTKVEVNDDEEEQEKRRKEKEKKAKEKKEKAEREKERKEREAKEKEEKAGRRANIAETARTFCKHMIWLYQMYLYMFPSCFFSYSSCCPPPSF